MNKIENERKCKKKEREEERRVERGEGKKFCTKGKDGRQHATNPIFLQTLSGSKKPSGGKGRNTSGRRP